MLPRVIFFSLHPPENDPRTMNEALSLSETGFNVTIIALGKQSSQEKHVAINSNLNIEYIFLASRSLPRLTPILIIKYLELIFRMLWKSWLTKAKIFHACELPALPVMWLMAKLRKGRVVYDARELYFDRPFARLPWMWQYIQSRLINSTDAVIAANEARAMIMHEEYGTLEAPWVIHTYPPYQEIKKSSVLRSFILDMGLNWNNILLHQGRVIPDRAVEQIIQALVYVPGNNGVIFLGFVSEEYKKYLLHLATSVNVSSRVLFHPFIPTEKLYSYTASATIGLVLYLNTSKNNYYCAPTKLYEYLMAGLPVIGSDFPSLREIICGNKIGIVTNPESPMAIAEAMNSLLQDKDNRTVLGSNARNSARQLFNWEKEREKFLNIYQNL